MTAPLRRESKLRPPIRYEIGLASTSLLFQAFWLSFPEVPVVGNKPKKFRGEWAVAAGLDFTHGRVFHSCVLARVVTNGRG